MAIAIVDSEKLDTDLTTIADAIRGKTGGTEPLSFPEGMAAELDAVYEAGKQAEYDAFWDAHQNFGERVRYDYAFAGSGWTPDIFRPKYDIRPSVCSYMFAAADASWEAADLDQLIKEAGIVFDTSMCTNFTNMFMYSSPRVVPVIDTTGASTLSSMFLNCSVVEIKGIILRDDGSQNLTNMFRATPGIRKMEIQGTIGQNGFDVSLLRLDKASLTSIINALSTTTSGLTVTIKLSAVNTAFETSEGAADGSASDEWLALAATKSNWTISLA